MTVRRKRLRKLFIICVCIGVLLYICKRRNTTTISLHQKESYLADTTLHKKVVTTFIVTSKRHFIKFTQRTDLNASNAKTTFDNKLVLPYRQTADANVFMFSAIVIKKIHHAYDRTLKSKVNSRDHVTDQILINGWAYKHLQHSKCCLYLHDGKISVESSAKIVYHQFASLPLRSTQFTCTLTDGISKIKGVFIATNDSACISNELYYIQPIPQIDDNSSSVAICSKLAYGSVNAQVLLEWFEVQRLLGINKILVYTYKLNTNATKVINFYETIGLAIIIRDFDFPVKDIYSRDVGGQNPHAWSDLQVVMNDCQARLNGFKYVAILDKDEFMIPRNIKAFNFSMRHFLDHTFTEDTAGIITMLGIQHITTWGTSNTTSKLYIERYINSTGPMIDRQKYIYMPTRVRTGLVAVHGIDTERGYVTRMLPATVISLHHYRKCRGGTYDIGHQQYKDLIKTDHLHKEKHLFTCSDFKHYNNMSVDLVQVITAMRDLKTKSYPRNTLTTSFFQSKEYVECLVGQ